MPSRAAAAAPLVKSTRWALAILCIAVLMQRISCIPVCMPIASPALMHGKQQQELGKHPGKDDTRMCLEFEDLHAAADVFACIYILFWCLTAYLRFAAVDLFKQFRSSFVLVI